MKGLESLLPDHRRWHSACGGSRTSREDLILKDKERTQPDAEPRPHVATRRSCHVDSRDD
jgi:hypothetical protein